MSWSASTHTWALYIEHDPACIPMLPHFGLIFDYRIAFGQNTHSTSKDQFNNDDGQGGRRLKDSFRGKVNVFNQRCNSLRRFFHPISFLKPSRFFLSSCHSHSKTKTSFFYNNLSSLPFSLMSFILVPTGTEQIDGTVKKLYRTSAFPDSCDFYQIRQHCTRNLS